MPAPPPESEPAIVTAIAVMMRRPQRMVDRSPQARSGQPRIGLRSDGGNHCNTMRASINARCGIFQRNRADGDERQARAAGAGAQSAKPHGRFCIGFHARPKHRADTKMINDAGIDCIDLLRRGDRQANDRIRAHNRAPNLPAHHPARHGRRQRQPLWQYRAGH